MKPKKYETLLEIMQRLDDCQSLANALTEPQIARKTRKMAKARQNIACALQRDLSALQREILRLV